MSRAAAHYGARVSGKPSAMNRSALIVPSVVDRSPTIDAKRAAGLVETETIDDLRWSRVRVRDLVNCTTLLRAALT